MTKKKLCMRNKALFKFFAKYAVGYMNITKPPFKKLCGIILTQCSNLINLSHGLNLPKPGLN